MDIRHLRKIFRPFVYTFSLLFGCDFFIIFRSFYGEKSKQTASKLVEFVSLPDGSVSDEEDFVSDNDEDTNYVSDSDDEAMESGSEEEIEEDGLPDAEIEPAMKRKKAQAKDQIRWKHGKNLKFETPADYVACNERLRIKPSIPLTRFSSPMCFYELFVNDSIINHIHQQTQLYNEWRKLNSSTRTVKDIEIQEIKIVIGIVLQMGIVKLPNRRMYWAPDTRNELIAENMTRNRFDEIVSVLHFNDNTTMPDRDSVLFNKCHKIQPLIDHFRNIFRQHVLPETHMAIDEQVVPFKGHHSLKRYLPKKPKKWGYKVWARAGISGYVYDFEVEGGLGSKGAPADSEPPTECGESGFVVLRLTSDLDPFKHEVFFDNYFSSPELLKYLKQEKKIWAVSTLNGKRARQCPISTEKEMKKNGRGFSQQFVDTSGSVVVTTWYDNKRVLTVSNYAGKEPLGICKRYDRAAKKKIDVERPFSVEVYNKFMGGVDKADMLLSLYRTRYRSRKWYHRIAFHLFSLAAVNAWLLYRQMDGNKPLVMFLGQICYSLIRGSTKSDEDVEEIPQPSVHRSLRANDVPADIRSDKYDHWPVLIDVPNSQRCKNKDCKKKTKFYCSKCQVYLCVSNNICFRQYHGVIC